MKTYTCIATCPMGFESTIKSELQALGFSRIAAQDGAVEFDTDEKGICIANMSLRCADRILLKIGQFKATDFDELFDRTKALPWADFIPYDGEFPVDKISLVKSKLFAESVCQGMVKKAVVESLRAAHGKNNLPETGERHAIRITIRNDLATLSINTSGDSLHKRGYRSSALKAPMRETLAALLVKLAKWYPDKGPLIDPLCGSGTIVIEAALMAKRVAPNRDRSFDCYNWGWIGKDNIQKAKEEVRTHEREIPTNRIFASDIRASVVEAAIENAKAAGVNDVIQFKCRDVLSLKKDKYDYALGEESDKKDIGYIIVNPPYGDRLDEQEDADKLYEGMGKVFLSEFPNWNYFIITPQREFETLFGKKSTKNRKLFNGGKECHLYQYMD